MARALLQNGATSELDEDGNRPAVFLGLLSRFIDVIALPETHLAPEKNYLEKEIPLGNHHF